MRLGLILIFASIGFSAALRAETLESIKLRLPADATTIHKKCAAAFGQLQADRLATEARENFQCLAIIQGEYLKSVEAGFMIQCTNSVNMRIDGAYGEVTVDNEILQNSFNAEYRPLIASECATRESKRISDYNASHKSHGEFTAGSALALRENCFLRSSCFSHH